jgi:serine-type D-Ala-D-Ala carboxypeptidase
MTFKRLDIYLSEALGKTYTAVQAEVRQHGTVIYRRALGTLDSDNGISGESVTEHTLFDYASLTKLFTATAFFRLVEAGKVRLTDRVATVIPELNGTRFVASYPNPLNIAEKIAVEHEGAAVDIRAVDFRHILTHSSGLPPWLNLRSAGNIHHAVQMCLNASFAYDPGAKTMYSDIGFILLGIAIARIYGASLEQALGDLVVRPLASGVRYLPISSGLGVQTAPTEFCTWRKRRIIGEVHDENCAVLNGVTGHAGLFGTATDAAQLAQVYVDHGMVNGQAFLSAALADDATRLHIGDRGLGWMMRTSGISSSGQYFSDNSYGHTGFVGNSLWIDPQRGLVCALLTNYVYFGRNADTIHDFRRGFHDTVIRELEGAK